MYLFGNAATIGDNLRNRIQARSFQSFHPTGRWYKCPDCPAAVASRKLIPVHRELHWDAGDYDPPEDDNDGEHPGSGPDSG